MSENEKIFIDKEHPQLREKGYYWICVKGGTPEIGIYGSESGNKWVDGKCIGREHTFCWLTFDSMSECGESFYETDVEVISKILKPPQSLSNKEYTNLVEQGKYPENNIVALDPPFVDERGSIQNLLNTSINGAAVITSKKGSKRSNHWHREDWHFLYVMSGSMEYWEKPVDGNHEWTKKIINQGEMVFTAPQMVHKTIFLQDTVLLSFSKRNRDHDSHEEDVVRLGM